MKEDPIFFLVVLLVLYGLYRVIYYLQKGCLYCVIVPSIFWPNALREKYGYKARKGLTYYAEKALAKKNS
jgi:hypothetical protein